MSDWANFSHKPYLVDIYNEAPKNIIVITKGSALGMSFAMPGFVLKPLSDYYWPKKHLLPVPKSYMVSDYISGPSYSSRHFEQVDNYRNSFYGKSILRNIVNTKAVDEEMEVVRQRIIKSIWKCGT